MTRHIPVPRIEVVCAETPGARKPPMPKPSPGRAFFD